MKSKYVLIISNKFLHKEIEVPSNVDKIVIGTSSNADVRLRKDDFFEPVNFLLINNKNNWQIGCADNLYINDDDGIAKVLIKRISHGSEFEIRYQSSEQLVFNCVFQLNFESEEHKFNKIVDVNSSQNITFGNYMSDDFILNSPYTQNLNVILRQVGEGLQIVEANAPYGFYINGREAFPGEIIHNTDFFSISDCFFYYRQGRIWTEDSIKVNIPNLPCRIYEQPRDYPKFTRNTRVKTVVNETPIEILDPPAKPQKPKDNIILRLLPSLGFLVAAAFMSRMGGSMIGFAIVSAGMGLVTSIATLIDNKKQYKKDSKKRIEDYTAYIGRKRKEIEEARAKEKEELEEIYISIDEELARLKGFSPALFDRQKKDSDFLCIRLGEGLINSNRHISYKKKESIEFEDELQNMPLQLSGEFMKVGPAPVVCDLKKENAIGVCGNENFRYDFFKNILLDIISRHYYTDVKIAFVTGPDHLDWIEDLRFIPHLINPVSGTRNIVSNEDSKNQLYEYLYNELTTRKGTDNSNREKEFEYNIVVFFIEECGFKNHPISKFVDKLSELGVTFIFFEEEQDKLPQGCAHIIAPSSNTEGVLIETENKNNFVNFNYKGVSDKQMIAIAKMLAPVYSEELSLEGSLTKSLTLFELLNCISADDLNLESRWNSSQAFKTMKAPIGVTNQGVVELDLHDSAHGPHGLVAGTTGSGKSELLLTYILSMSTLYHPYEVGFVIIDFKGGGMANQLKDLPHLIGTITNIDGKEIDRSLKSIKAELQKRQRLFAEAEVNHIDKYILKYKKGEVEVPLPHLIIIVDEFAELKAEQPDFMKELISAARIGRSLGVHLILATQKPAGQVDDQIWSNSRFKLCLKVQDASDSNEVLKSPLAAEIKEPGRAYLQVGNNEIFELFQSGYSGAPEKMDAIGVKAFKIFEIQKSGQKKVVYEQKKKAVESNITQLDAVVDHIANYTKSKNIAKLPPICLPSLEHVIPFNNAVQSKDNGIIVNIGIYDVPENQVQLPYEINLTQENIIMTGSAQTGKSNLLQTIIRSASTNYSPKEVVFYIADFASMFLKTFESLTHVGGVVTASEDEKLKNLIKLLLKETIQRKERFLEVGVSSYYAYLEAGFKDLPQIVFIIDNMAALKDTYFEDDDSPLLEIIREGQSLGICTIVTNSMSSNIGFKYLSNFSCKMAFFNNDSSEYSTLFDHCREKVDDIKGRCLIAVENDHYDCQTLLSFEGEKEIDKKNAILDYIDETNDKYEGMKAMIIPEIPEVVTADYIYDNYRFKEKDFTLPIGLDYATVNPITMNFSQLGGCLAFTGREDFGQSEFLHYILTSLNEKYSDRMEVYIVDNMKKELKEFEKYGNVQEYSIFHSKAAEFINEIEETAQERYNLLTSGEDIDIAHENLLVLIMNNKDSIESTSEDALASKAFKNLLTKYKGMNVCIIVSNFENTTISYASPEVAKQIRDNAQFIIFDDLNAVQVIDINYMALREYSKKVTKGDAYLVKGESIDKMRIVM